MISLKDILCDVLNEGVSIKEINDAINSHCRVIINYHTNGKNKRIGPRIIEVYAYGLSQSGNPVIRAFQPYGDTTTRIPSWKLFRLDRISTWRKTNQHFEHSADFYYNNVGKFNSEGDGSMSVVYKVSNFKQKNTNDSRIQNTKNINSSNNELD